MSANSQNYSIAGVIDLATDANGAVINNPVASFVGSNLISETGKLVFGNGQPAEAAAGVSTDVIEHAMGAPLTHSRNTSEILALNLARKTGAPQALSSSAGGIKAFFGTAGRALNAGLTFAQRVAVDSALVTAEALGCLGPREW